MNMKRKKLLIIVSVFVVIAITVVVAITQSPKWSRLSFEAVVQETAIQPDGEVRLIVRRTTEVYSDPLNSLHIDENTTLIGKDGKSVKSCLSYWIFVEDGYSGTNFATSVSWNFHLPSFEPPSNGQRFFYDISISG